MIKSITSSVSINENRAALMEKAASYLADGKALLALRALENALLLRIDEEVQQQQQQQRQQQPTETTAPRGAAEVEHHDAVDTDAAQQQLPPASQPSSNSLTSTQRAAGRRRSSTAAPTSRLEEDAEAFVMQCNTIAARFIRDDNDAYSATDALYTALVYLVDRSSSSEFQRPSSAAAPLAQLQTELSTALFQQVRGPGGGPLSIARQVVLPPAAATEIRRRIQGKSSSFTVVKSVPSPSPASQNATSSPTMPSSPISFAASDTDGGDDSSGLVGLPSEVIPWAALGKRRDELLALTCNNMGCVARLQRQPADAVHWFHASVAADPNGFSPLGLLAIASVHHTLEKRDCIEFAKLAVKQMERLVLHAANTSLLLASTATPASLLNAAAPPRVGSGQPQPPSSSSANLASARVMGSSRFLVRPGSPREGGEGGNVVVALTWSTELLAIAYHELAVVLETIDGNAAAEWHRKCQAILENLEDDPRCAEQMKQAASGMASHNDESRSLMHKGATQYVDLHNRLKTMYAAQHPQPQTPQPPAASQPESGGRGGGRPTSPPRAGALGSHRKSFSRQPSANAAAAATGNATSSSLATNASHPPSVNVVVEIPKDVQTAYRNDDPTNIVTYVTGGEVSVTPAPNEAVMALVVSASSVSPAAPTSATAVAGPVNHDGIGSSDAAAAGLPTAPRVDTQFTRPVTIPSSWLIPIDIETPSQRIPRDHRLKLVVVPAVVLAAMPSLSPKPPGEGPDGASSRGGGSLRKRSAAGSSSGSTGKGSGSRHDSIRPPNNSNGASSGAAGGGVGGQAGPNNSMQPPVLSISPEALVDELKKRDDVVSFLATRLTQLLRIEDYHNQRHAAAVRIQWFIRPFLAKRLAAARKAIAERNRRLLEVRRNAAARRIVNFFRMVVSMRRKVREQREAIRLHAKRRREAAIVLQKYGRRWNAQQLVARMRRRKANEIMCAVAIQRWVRGCLAKQLALLMKEVSRRIRVQGSLREKWHRSASRIQAAYRMHRRRIDFHIAVGNDAWALWLDQQKYRTTHAIAIQRVVRGFLVRQRWDGVLRPRCVRVRNELRALAVNRAATEIQRCFRGFSTRSSDVGQRVDAAVKRAIVARVSAFAKREYEAAVEIQRIARGWVTRRRNQRSSAATTTARPSRSTRPRDEQPPSAAVGEVAPAVLDLDDEGAYFLGIRREYGILREAPIS